MRETRATSSSYDEHYALQKLYMGVFLTPEGEKVLKDLVERVCGINQSPFNENPQRTAYNTGRQDVARELLRLCNPRLDPPKPNVIMDRKP